jgi:hypothetical protein
MTRLPDPAARWPVLPRQPRQLAAGLCVGHPHRDWWTSDGHAEREAACHVCCACPVRGPCLAWSLHLPASDRAVYGGLSAAQRQQLARQRTSPAA